MVANRVPPLSLLGLAVLLLLLYPPPSDLSAVAHLQQTEHYQVRVNGQSYRIGEQATHYQGLRAMCQLAHAGRRSSSA